MRPVLKPGPRHAITIEPHPGRVVVSVAGRTVADTTAALILRESGYPPVQYLPLRDVDSSLLERSDSKSYCPYKGEASYVSIPAGGARSVDAGWVYESPHPAMERIRGHIAFYPDRVDEIAQT